MESSWACLPNLEAGVCAGQPLPGHPSQSSESKPWSSSAKSVCVGASALQEVRMQNESSQQSTKPYRSLVGWPGHMWGVTGAMGSKEFATPPGGILTQAEEPPASPQLNSRLHKGKALVRRAGVVLSTVE